MLLSKDFDVKILPRIGPPAYGGQVAEGDHLGRTIGWTSEGFTWEGNAKHIKDVWQLMGVDPAKASGAVTPASKHTGKNQRDVTDELDEEQATTFRQAAGTMMHLAEDIPSIRWATNDTRAVYRRLSKCIGRSCCALRNTW